MRSYRWFVVLVACGLLGVVLYSFGVPYWLVYIARGVLRHVAYGHGGH